MAIATGGCSLVTDLPTASVPPIKAGAGGTGGTGGAGSTGGAGGAGGAGGSTTATYVTYATGEAAPGAIAVDAKHVYWTAGSPNQSPGGSVRRAVLAGDGKTETVLITDDTFSGLAVAGGEMWSSLRTLDTGCASGRRAVVTNVGESWRWSMCTTSETPSTVSDQVGFGGALFWTFRTVTMVQPPANSVIVNDDKPLPGVLTVNATHVYFSVPQASSLRRAPKSADSISELWLTGESIVQLAASEDEIFWVNAAGELRGAESASVKAEPYTLVDGIAGAVELIYHGDALYWAEVGATSGSGAIRSVGTGVGLPVVTTYAEPIEVVGGLAVTNAGIFYTDSASGEVFGILP